MNLKRHENCRLSYFYLIVKMIIMGLECWPLAPYTLRPTPYTLLAMPASTIAVRAERIWIGIIR